MLQITIILSLTLALVSTGNLEPRIIGGHYATPNQFPFIVSIRNRADKHHFCAGTLLTGSWIITAAHCFEKNVKAEDLEVTSGSVYIDDFKACDASVEKIIPHPDATVDIALLKQHINFIYVLCSIAVSPSKIRPINIDKSSNNLKVRIAGWGSESKSDSRNNADVLKYTELWTSESDKFCTNTPTVFCAKVSDGGAACGNDYGGPVTYGEGKNARLVGIVTHSSSECATAGQSEMFTRVSAFKEWIIKQTNSRKDFLEVVLSGINFFYDTGKSVVGSISGTVSKISNLG